MEESLGDILYIVFMVVALVISVIVKAKKTPHEATPVPEHEMSDALDDEEDIPFSEWFNGKDERPKEAVVISTASQQSDGSTYSRMKSPLKDSYQNIKHEQEIRRFNKGVPQTPPRIILRPGDEEENEPAVSTWFDDSHDLRRAIIYSEILKRPSF